MNGGAVSASRRSRSAGDDHLHLEQIDERPAARHQSVALEQRLLLDGFEIEILRQRVDQVFVGHRRRDLRIDAAPALRLRHQQRFEPSPLLADDRAIGLARFFHHRFDAGDPVAAAVILSLDAELLESPQHDVVAAVGVRSESVIRPAQPTG